MESSNTNDDRNTAKEEHLNLNPEERIEQQSRNNDGAEATESETAQSLPPPSHQPSRTPFTHLSQVDADLALARTLQEQERAYMMLRMNNDGSDYGSWEAGSYLHDDDFDDPHDGIDIHDEDEDEDEDEEEEEEEEEDEDGDYDEEYEDEEAFDVQAHAHDDDDDDDIEEHNPAIEFDPDVYSGDEAYARALQDAEEREMAARMLALAGINDRNNREMDNRGANSQDAWEDVDPDELSYEELIALGEVVGTESRGLSADTIATLPSVSYKAGSNQNGSNDSCVICRLDFEDGDTLTVLSCKHSYHSECINNWLKINKVCPVCSAEVSTSNNS